MYDVWMDNGIIPCAVLRNIILFKKYIWSKLNSFHTRFNTNRWSRMFLPFLEPMLEQPILQSMVSYLSLRISLSKIVLILTTLKTPLLLLRSPFLPLFLCKLEMLESWKIDLHLFHKENSFKWELFRSSPPYLNISYVCPWALLFLRVFKTVTRSSILVQSFITFIFDSSILIAIQ